MPSGVGVFAFIAFLLFLWCNAHQKIYITTGRYHGTIFDPHTLARGL
jgi:hypothetical protein